MKDLQARRDIDEVHIQARKNLEAVEARLHTRINELTKAFDALFDIVAQDLGYKALYDAPYPGLAGLRFPVTPRRFAKTTPEIVRTPTARCKGQKA